MKFKNLLFLTLILFSFIGLSENHDMTSIHVKSIRQNCVTQYPYKCRSIKKARKRLNCLKNFLENYDCSWNLEEQKQELLHDLKEQKNHKTLQIKKLGHTEVIKKSQHKTRESLIDDSLAFNNLQIFLKNLDRYRSHIKATIFLRLKNKIYPLYDLLKQKTINKSQLDQLIKEVSIAHNSLISTRDLFRDKSVELSLLPQSIKKEITKAFSFADDIAQELSIMLKELNKFNYTNSIFFTSYLNKRSNDCYNTSNKINKLQTDISIPLKTKLQKVKELITELEENKFQCSNLCQQNPTFSFCKTDIFTSNPPEINSIVKDLEHHLKTKNFDWFSSYIKMIDRYKSPSLRTIISLLEGGFHEEY